MLACVALHCTHLYPYLASGCVGSIKLRRGHIMGFSNTNGQWLPLLRTHYRAGRIRRSFRASKLGLTKQPPSRCTGTRDMVVLKQLASQGRGDLTNLLYWPLIAACLYTGYPRFTSLGPILVLGTAAAVRVCTRKAEPILDGLMNERGLGYLLTLVIGSSAVTGLFFGAGWLLGRALA